MRLLNLSLETWRGIDSRQIELSGGVTLIEGPNEIGKSTIVEAVRMLFSEMDSSKKKEVKAIQPIGQAMVEDPVIAALAIQKQHGKNKLTVAERLDLLFDHEEARFEVGAFAARSSAEAPSRPRTSSAESRSCCRQSGWL